MAATKRQIQTKMMTGSNFIPEQPTFAKHPEQPDSSPLAIESPAKPKFRGLSHELANSSTARQPVIQAKLTIGQPDDRYEREADRIASDVVTKINAPTVANAERSAITGNEDPKPSLIQRRSAIASDNATPDLESSIQSARGSGNPLSETIRKPMEQAFGADFSGVKVHTDSQSDQLNESIQAKAFTTGQDVFFRQGAYEPTSRSGQELIAHELTHVVQQNGGAVQRSPQRTSTSLVGDERIQRVFGFGKKKKGYQELDDDQEALLGDSESVELEEEEDGVEIEAGPLSYQNGVVTIPIWGDQDLKIGRSGVDLEGALPSKEFALDLPSFSADIDIPFAPGAYATAGLEIAPTVSFTISGGTYSIKAGAEKTLSISDAGVEGTMGLDITAKAGVGVGIANFGGLEAGIFGTLGGSAKLSGKLGGTANFSTKSYALNLGLNASADIVGKAGAYVSAKLAMLRATKKFSLIEKTFANFSYTRNIELGGGQGAWKPSLTDFTQKEYGDRKTSKILKTVDGKTYAQLIDED